MVLVLLVKLKIVMLKGSFWLIVNHIKDVISAKILAIDWPYHAALTWNTAVHECNNILKKTEHPVNHFIP